MALTQTGAAHLCGVSKRTVAAWEAGETETPHMAQALLWACLRDPPLMEAIDRAKTASEPPGGPA
jgi:DNA-binding transcriptional regulator YiaG